MFDVLGDMRVCDFGKFVAAPCSTWLLSNMRADAVKVEPLGGSPDRESFGISEDLDGGGFLQLRSNNRSICLAACGGDAGTAETRRRAAVSAISRRVRFARSSMSPPASTPRSRLPAR